MADHHYNFSQVTPFAEELLRGKPLPAREDFEAWDTSLRTTSLGSSDHFQERVMAFLGKLDVPAKIHHGTRSFTCITGRSDKNTVEVVLPTQYHALPVAQRLNLCLHELGHVLYSNSPQNAELCFLNKDQSEIAAALFEQLPEQPAWSTWAGDGETLQKAAAGYQQMNDTIAGPLRHMILREFLSPEPKVLERCQTVYTERLQRIHPSLASIPSAKLLWPTFGLQGRFFQEQPHVVSRFYARELNGELADQYGPNWGSTREALAELKEYFSTLNKTEIITERK